MKSNPGIEFGFMLIQALLIVAFFAFMGGGVIYCMSEFIEAVQEDPGEDVFGEFLNGTTPSAVFYQNITVLEKEHRNRNMLSDVFNVVYKTESGDIQVDNNRTLYYSVEAGQTYNVSGQYQITGIV